MDDYEELNESDFYYCLDVDVFFEHASDNLDLAREAVFDVENVEDD